MSVFVSSKSKGFTLIEMLIATSLAAVILTLVFSGMMTVQNSWEQSQRLKFEVQDVKLVDRFLRSRMSRAIFLPTSNAGEPVTFFEGRADRFRYMAPMMTYVGFPGIYLQSLSLKEDQLTFEWQPYRQDTQRSTESQRILLDEVSDFKIAYFGLLRNGQRSGWQDYWDMKQGTPNAVRLQYKYQGVDMPEIVVPLLW